MVPNAPDKFFNNVKLISLHVTPLVKCKGRSTDWNSMDRVSYLCVTDYQVEYCR
jgi:hypothetical protein